MNGSRAALTFFLVALVGATGCGNKNEPHQSEIATSSTPSQRQKDPAMSSTDDLFKTIQDLIASRPFSVDGVAKVTGHKLHQDTKTWNQLFSEFSSEEPTHPFFRATELRIPERDLPRSTARDGILILTVQPSLCVELKDVEARFGKDPIPMMPSAHAPLSEPMGYEYRLPWGALRFGISREGRECLKDVVLDAV